MGYRVYSGHLIPVLISLFLFQVEAVYSDESISLPEPLTLDAALQQTGNVGQYQIIAAQEGLKQALAEAGLSSAENDVSVNLSGRLRAVGVSELGDEDEDNDSKVSLFVRKPLYDFGKTAEKDQLATLNIELKRLELAYLMEQRELLIVEKYLAVLNADNQYLRDNEDLAIGFIRFDRARENQELGLASEIEVKELQAKYEVIRQNRSNSENLQRLTRILLAEELGFPENPPSEVAVPDLLAKSRITDEVDVLVEQAFKHSLLMKIQLKKLELSRQAITTAEQTISPSFDAELEISEYSREGATRDDWRATLYFDFPLYTGSREEAAVDRANAQHRQALSDMQKLRSELRIEVLQLWQAIRQNSLRLDGELVNQEYRDMYLDKSRAEYELEFKTDLGDAMVQFSNSRKQVYQARFDLELAWRKLEKLVGKDFLNTLQSQGVNNG